jgi:hypothetical protein
MFHQWWHFDLIGLTTFSGEVFSDLRTFIVGTGLVCIAKISMED